MVWSIDTTQCCLNSVFGLTCTPVEAPSTCHRPPSEKSTVLAKMEVWPRFPVTWEKECLLLCQVSILPNRQALLIVKRLRKGQVMRQLWHVQVVLDIVARQTTLRKQEVVKAAQEAGLRATDTHITRALKEICQSKGANWGLKRIYSGSQA